MILLDCDGVLADFVGAIRSRLESRGLPIEEDQIRVLADFVGAIRSRLESRGLPIEEDQIRHLDLSKSLSKEQMRIVDQISQDPAFCFQIQPYSYAKDLITWLQDKGHEYAIVTAPWTPPGWCDERMDWLTWHLKIPRTRVIFASGPMKRHVRGDVIVEDSPENLFNWRGGDRVLVKRPWNETPASPGWEVSPENLIETLKGLVE